MDLIVEYFPAMQIVIKRNGWNDGMFRFMLSVSINAEKVLLYLYIIYSFLETNANADLFPISD